MKNPIENLGDYGKVVEDLNKFDGSLEKLYQSIKDTGVAEAAPRLMLKGGMITTSIFGGIAGIAFIGRVLKKRKEALKQEAALKQDFVETMEKSMASDVNKEPNRNGEE